MPERVGSAATPAATGRIFRASFFNTLRTESYVYVLDVPAWRSVRMSTYEPGATNSDPGSILNSNFLGIVLEIGSGDERWLFLERDTVDEMERSHYSGCFYDCVRSKSPAAQIEQLVASMWPTTTGNDGEWVWP